MDVDDLVVQLLAPKIHVDQFQFLRCVRHHIRRGFWAIRLQIHVVTVVRVQKVARVHCRLPSGSGSGFGSGSEALTSASASSTSSVRWLLVFVLRLHFVAKVDCAVIVSRIIRS